MGRIALALSDRCTGPAAWLMVSNKACREAGYSNFSDLDSALRDDPPEFSEGGLHAGTLMTSSPTASHVVSLLVADRSFNSLRERVTRLGFSLPAEPESPF